MMHFDKIKFSPFLVNCSSLLLIGDEIMVFFYICILKRHVTDTVFLKNSNSIIDDMSNHIMYIGDRGGSYCKFIMLLRTTKNKQYERLYLFKTSRDGHYFL